MSIVMIDPDSPVPFGQELHRPECVLPTPSGDVFVPDWRGGVAVVRADGSTQYWLANDDKIDLKPNGIAFYPNGDFLIANLGDSGGIWRLDRSGNLTAVLTELNGSPLPPANFVYLDEEERIWITVSTRHRPRQNAWRHDISNGFVVLLDRNGAKIVADGLHYTNEARVDPSGRYLYVIETFGRRLLRYPILGSSLGKQEITLQLDIGCLPDGFAFDEDGGIWITSLVSNQLLRLGPDGRLQSVLAETNNAWIAEVSAAYMQNTMTKKHLGPIPDTRFQHLTSIGFGGPDRKTGYLGSLHAECLYKFTSDVAGVKQPYWDYPLP
jgi:sugar lactone lactonase YvrE